MGSPCHHDRYKSLDLPTFSSHILLYYPLYHFDKHFGLQLTYSPRLEEDAKMRYVKYKPTPKLYSSPRYAIAKASEYLVLTGVGIEDLRICKKAIVFPGQRVCSSTASNDLIT